MCVLCLPGSFITQKLDKSEMKCVSSGYPRLSSQHKGQRQKTEDKDRREKEGGTGERHI